MRKGTDHKDRGAISLAHQTLAPIPFPSFTLRKLRPAQLASPSSKMAVLGEVLEKGQLSGSANLDLLMVFTRQDLAQPSTLGSIFSSR